MSCRSLRIEYSVWSNRARRSFSGGMDGRPVLAYSRAKRGDSARSTSSTSVRIGRKGWSAGTRCSGRT